MHRPELLGSAVWLRVMVGNADCVEEVRGTDIPSLVAKAVSKSSVDVEQIDLDLKRNLGRAPEKIQPVRNILVAWTALNSGIGYSQGMDTVCIVLYDHFCLSGSPSPEHDTLGALGFVLRVNAGYLPLHKHDKAPLNSAMFFATEMWMEIGSAHPSLGGKILPALGLFEIFALQHLSVCFANLFDKDSIHVLWKYLFREQDLDASQSKVIVLSARRCRHFVSACVIHHKKLWLYGKDDRQNFQIWESTLKICTPETLSAILDVAFFLERVETLGGAAQ